MDYYIAKHGGYGPWSNKGSEGSGEPFVLQGKEHAALMQATEDFHSYSVVSALLLYTSICSILPIVLRPALQDTYREELPVRSVASAAFVSFASG